MELYIIDTKSPFDNSIKSFENSFLTFANLSYKFDILINLFLHCTFKQLLFYIIAY